MNADERRSEKLTTRYKAAADTAEASGLAPLEVYDNLRSAQYSALLEQVARLSQHVSMGTEVVAAMDADERERHRRAIETRIDNRALEIATDLLDARLESRKR